MKTYDVAIAGAGPAGITAALRLAQKGLNVLLVERGETPGAKNMFGGMLPNCPIAEELLPGFWEQAPWERHVVKRVLTVIADSSATSFAFEGKNFDTPPYNGYTLFRPIFDKWYAEKAREAGATLLTGCLVENLLQEGNAVSGIRIGRDNGEVKARVTIACDGVLSLLSKKAGICKAPKASDMALGIKALFHLKEEDINERFNLVRRQGVSQEFLGCTEGIRGGGFIYTQTETLSVGLVFHLDSLKKSGIAPYDLFYRFLSLDAVRRILRGARLMEYSAHLLPEGGYKLVPKLFTDGLLLAGDAAALCYTNGLNQEGMNLAMTSGFLAAETIIDAFQKGDFSSRQLSRYEARLKESFVLRDMKTFEKTVDFMHNDRLFSVYPNVVGTIMEEMFRSDGKPRRKIARLSWSALKEAVPIKQVVSDVLEGGKSLL
ncbi:MAG: Electron transfer flavoprotein-ubiquinone oxidoreductase [Syntrophorhabdaceae bacterium PtaU1.Bin034]|nr:MAG: Electron transfer flavoprotein-ubiquinone oxidoreductase [Syntrophorhabdaceae bacterium PtaU1.Bin034]